MTPGMAAMGIIVGRWSWTFAFAAVSLIGSALFGTPALAQVQRSGEPSQGFQANLTGDWGGLRSYLERIGITFTLNYTNDFLANVHLVCRLLLEKKRKNKGNKPTRRSR